MSVYLMSLAFKAKVNSTQKLVLLALCDSANDQGECYPSISNLMEKSSLGERTVQEQVSMLESAGYLRREFRNGRSTIYWMNPGAQPPQQAHPRSRRTPAPAAPTPAFGAPPPPQQAHPTPAPAAPITIIEPSRKQKKAPTCVGLSVLLDAGFDEDTASEFIAHKHRMKAPLTARAWNDHVSEANKAGWTPKQAAEKVMAKSWKGFEAKYVSGETPNRASKTRIDTQLETAALMTGLSKRKTETEYIDVDSREIATRILG